MKPDKKWFDRCKEFYEKAFGDFLKKHDKQTDSRNFGLKTLSIESFNR